MDRSKSVSKWIRVAKEIIESKFNDAYAHAWNALTQSVVHAPDGRKTISAVLNTKGYQSSVKKLDSLVAKLAGNSRNSYDGLIRDARSDFYKSSVEHWEGVIPSDLWAAPILIPTKAGERMARSLVIHGHELYTQLRVTIDKIIISLRAALVSSGASLTSDEEARAVLDAWKEREMRSFISIVEGLISDSEVGVHYATGHILVHPKFHEE